MLKMELLKRHKSALSSMHEEYFTFKKTITVPYGKGLCISLKNTNENLSVTAFKTLHVHDDLSIQIINAYIDHDKNHVNTNIHMVHETVTNRIKRFCLKSKTGIDIESCDNRYIIFHNNVIIAKIAVNNLTHKIKLSCIDTYVWTIEHDEAILFDKDILASSDGDIIDVLSSLGIHSEDLH